MGWVIFLRAANVGKHNRFRPGILAKELAKFGVINVGAVGTFVVTEDVSEKALRAVLARKLAFKCDLMICPAKAIVDLAQKNPFEKEAREGRENSASRRTRLTPRFSRAQKLMKALTQVARGFERICHPQFVDHKFVNFQMLDSRSPNDEPTDRNCAESERAYGQGAKRQCSNGLRSDRQCANPQRREIIRFWFAHVAANCRQASPTGAGPRSRRGPEVESHRDNRNWKRLHPLRQCRVRS